MDIPLEKQYVSKEKYDKICSDYENLKFQLDQLQRVLYGKRTERFIPAIDGQIDLFTETALEESQGEQTKTISYTRGIAPKKKKKPIRMVLPSHLPRVTEIIEPKDKEPGAKKIGEQITEILEYNPANIFVRQIIRPKYTKANGQGVLIAEMPSLPLPKANAGPGMLAHICVSKFIDHLPFYRQIQILKRQNLIISPSTMGDWFNGTCKLISPLFEALQSQVLHNADYLQADESPIKVQDNHKKDALHQGYMWLFRNPKNKLVLFNYDKGRSRKLPEKVLMNFTGMLQTDGYRVYQALDTKGEITLLGCMAHARRYFEKALSNDNNRASHALKQIQLLYLIEQKVRDRGINVKTIKRYRQLYAVPILEELKKWLDLNSFKVLPKSAIGTAIAYTLNIYQNLRRYVLEGNYEIDNNNIENAVRPLALGRKNYLFAGSHKAAQNIAMMYSFFASCKANDVNPYNWLENVLSTIQEHKVNKLQELLPNNWKL
jgi:transposase